MSKSQLEEIIEILTEHRHIPDALKEARKRKRERLQIQRQIESQAGSGNVILFPRKQ